MSRLWDRRHVGERKTSRGVGCVLFCASMRFRDGLMPGGVIYWTRTMFFFSVIVFFHYLSCATRCVSFFAMLFRSDA